MKQTRLLEIIREEIAGALREGEAEERAAKAAEIKAIDAKQKALDAEKRDTMKSGALEEDTLNEVPDSGNALQANQTNNAILKALGLKEPGQRGRKASEKSEPKAKSEKSPKTKKSPKAEKSATLTKGDDEFDSVEYSDDEGSAEAMKAAGSDKTAKELSSTPEEKKVKFNQFLASVKKNKDDKAKIDGILKLAKDKFKFAKTMMDDLKRAAGRKVEV